MNRVSVNYLLLDRSLGSHTGKKYFVVFAALCWFEHATTTHHKHLLLC